MGASGTASATINYSTGGAGGLQPPGGRTVPGAERADLCARRTTGQATASALLRVFVTANQVNAANPDVRVSFYSGGVLTSTADHPRARRSRTPLGANEGTLNSSWNLIVARR